MAHIKWKTYGEKNGANTRSEAPFHSASFWHLPFKLVSLLLWTNDRLKGAGHCDSGVFLEFHYMRININTFYVTLIWYIVKVFFPVLMDIGNLSWTTLNLCVFLLFVFFNFQHKWMDLIQQRERKVGSSLLLEKYWFVARQSLTFQEYTT